MNDRKNPTDIAAEPSAALTYGMSPELINSDLLWRISELNHQDKVCLVRFIQTEMREEESADDIEWSVFPQIGPQTANEAIARADASIKRYKQGDCLPSAEAKKQLTEELPWLR